MEQWKRIEGTNYEISNLGRVKSITTSSITYGKKSKTCDYYAISLKIIGKNKAKTYMVHRLVAQYFLENDNPSVKTQVNHKDKVKTNNIVENLEWVSPKENMAHHYQNGGVKRNNQNYKGKFGSEHNRSIKIEANGIIYHGYSEASRLTGIGITTIHHSIKRNKPLRSGIKFNLV